MKFCVKFVKNNETLVEYRDIRNENKRAIGKGVQTYPFHTDN